MIRPAEYEDLTECLLMGEKFHTMGRVSGTYDVDAVASLLDNLMNSDESILLVSDHGMIGGVLSPSYCDPSWIQAIELFWWSEDGRGGELMAEFEKWAFSKGASEVRMSSIEHLGKANQILTSKGYSIRELSYSKVL